MEVEVVVAAVVEREEEEEAAIVVVVVVAVVAVVIVDGTELILSRLSGILPLLFLLLLSLRLSPSLGSTICWDLVGNKGLLMAFKDACGDDDEEDAFFPTSLLGFPVVEEGIEEFATFEVVVAESNEEDRRILLQAENKSENDDG